MGRRAFFRRVLLGGLERVEQAGASLGRRFEQAGSGSSRAGIDGGQGAAFLRPPGAVEEQVFADRCSRCGDCVRACPAQCILLDPATAGGLPHIIPRQSPCVVCEDLSCMAVCQTGALERVESKDQIRMGRAVVDHDRCLRRPGVENQDPQALEDHVGGDPDCKLCVSDCPLEGDAIGLAADGGVEVRSGCVGCGVCERVCPTEPASIAVGICCDQK